MSTQASVPQQNLVASKFSTRAITMLHTTTLVAFLAASSAPTPLYHVYQQVWGFDATLLTLVFAVYAFALLLALLMAGRLSDHLGRRPLIIGSLLLQMGAMGVFLLASGPGWLLAARAVQGVATGLATASVGAALLDLDRLGGALINSIAPMLGMAGGALGSAALMMLAPAPLRTVYAVLMAVFVLALVATWIAPDTGSRRAGAWASLWPRIAVPVQARAALWMVTPINIALWMLGGFYLSLMPSLIVATTHVTSAWLGGAVVAALTLSGAAAILAARKLRTLATLLYGEGALGIGLLLILLGAHQGSTALLLAGSVIAGLGFGAAFLGALRMVLPLAEPHERAGLMGAFYVESYLANSVPTIAIGYVAHHAGLLTAVDLYGAVILGLIVLALLLTLRNRHKPH
jgi:MFS family permease